MVDYSALSQGFIHTSAFQESNTMSLVAGAMECRGNMKCLAALEICFLFALWHTPLMGPNDDARLRQLRLRNKF